MLKEISHLRLIGFWFAGVAVVVGSVGAMGVSVGVSTTALLLMASLVPPAILLLVWRGAPPPTVAEILHSAETFRGGRS